MKDNKQSSANKREICIHIFSVSAAMVGVCLTVIGIFRALAELKSFSSFGDDILALDALFFLASCILSYIALRSRIEENRQRYEKFADIIFISALSLMAVICCLIVYSIV